LPLSYLLIISSLTLSSNEKIKSGMSEMMDILIIFFIFDFKLFTGCFGWYNLLNGIFSVILFLSFYLRIIT